MTTADLLEILVTALVRAHGGTRRRWRNAIGAVRLYDARTHPHCNWSVTPQGSAADIAAIETLLDRVRIDHPLIAA